MERKKAQKNQKIPIPQPLYPDPDSDPHGGCAAAGPAATAPPPPAVVVVVVAVVMPPLPSLSLS
jgi:hypothetical protein